MSWPDVAGVVDLAADIDRQAYEGDSAHRALRQVSDLHAGVERRDQVLLRIGETVRSAEFAGLVDVDREPARHLFSTDLIALDFCAAPRLALPRRGDVPVRDAFCGFALDVFILRNQVAC